VTDEALMPSRSPRDASKTPIVLLGRGIAERIAYDTSAIGL
jgi:hypothetical protein